VFAGPVGESTTLTPISTDHFPAPLVITGPWEVRFPPNLGAPPAHVFDQLVSWTTIPIDGIKYFSGTATYFKQFEVPLSVVGAGARMELSLGQLRNVADTSLNGKALGIVWKPPYRYDVTDIIRSGTNELKIEIVNLWANRIVGDAKLPREKRVTHLTQKVSVPGPLESGLLGPVTLRVLPPASVSRGTSKKR
jgi:hypothetical protein